MVGLTKLELQVQFSFNDVNDVQDKLIEKYTLALAQIGTRNLVRERRGVKLWGLSLLL